MGSRAVLAPPGPALPALLPVLVMQPSSEDLALFFPFFFPFIIPCSIPALPQHHWAPLASIQGWSLLSLSPGGFAGHRHPLAVLRVWLWLTPHLSWRGWGLHSLFPALLWRGGIKDLKIHPTCGDPPGTALSR